MGESHWELQEAQQVAGNWTVPTQARERERTQTISHDVLEYRIFFEYGFCFYSYAKYISLLSKCLEQCHEPLFG